MNEYFENFIINRYHFYFISPHLDDAVLSCGGYISYLSKMTAVSVVNVFTKGGKRPYTLSAKRLLKKCGYRDADKFYEDREKEDKRVLKTFGIDVINLNFIDAPWRKKPIVNPANRILGKMIPELTHTYPLYRGAIEKGLISKNDFQIVEALSSQLEALIPKSKYVVFCPLSSEIHTDHSIVNNVCTKLFNNIVYWSDYPYNLSRPEKVPENFHTHTYLDNSDIKKRMILGYKSQTRLLFPDGKIKLVPERYYYLI